MSDNTIQAIFTIVALALGGFIALKASISSNKRVRKENEELAADLHWNLHSGSAHNLIHTLFQTLPADKNYYFFSTKIGDSGYYFDGTYKNTQFVLFPFAVLVREYARRYYLVAELKTDPKKNYDFVILSKAENSFWEYSGILHTYKKGKLESNEFGKKFAVYTRQADEAFYDFPPDKIAKLTDIYGLSLLNRIFIQVKQNTTLIAADYSPFNDWASGLNKIPKRQILSGFMDIAIMIADIFRTSHR